MRSILPLLLTTLSWHSCAAEAEKEILLDNKTVQVVRLETEIKLQRSQNSQL
jgi:hypothetical protein